MADVTYYPIIEHPKAACEDTIILPADIWEDKGVLLKGVKVTERWRYWDGVLSGFCEIEGQEFFFKEVVWDVWRYFDRAFSVNIDGEESRVEQDCERYSRVYGVYSVKPEIVREKKEGKWLDEDHQIIGVFIDYD